MRVLAGDFLDSGRDPLVVGFHQPELSEVIVAVRVEARTDEDHLRLELLQAATGGFPLHVVEAVRAIADRGTDPRPAGEPPSRGQPGGGLPAGGLAAVLHNRLPDVAGTLGISFVAAMQAASFPRVESWAYSSVMATTNLRQTIEGLFIAVTGSADPHRFRRPGVFAIVVGAFGVGAVASAYVTVQVPSLTLGIPVAFLLMALLRCEQDPDPVAS